MKTDKRIDSYIMKAGGFAMPILIYIRDMVHQACPDAEETMKWNFPHFMYRKKILCSMASFKKHCAFGFWKGYLMPEFSVMNDGNGKTSMGQFGRIESLKDLPSDKLFIRYIKSAMKLHDEDVKIPSRSGKGKIRMLAMPDYFIKALRKNKKSLKTFESFSVSKKNEYIQWVTEAKTDDTRLKRITTAIVWLEEGKDRNWKYHK